MKPILFNADMVRAILDGSKTVTRRVVKPQPELYGLLEPNWDWHEITRLYRPGDILYVRETYHKEDRRYMYKADYSDNEKFYQNGAEVEIKWRSSIHMPKAAARIFLRVTDVRVERLQQITVEGILAEGVDVDVPPTCKQSIDPDFPTYEQKAKWSKMTEAQREEYVKNKARATYIGWCVYADRLFPAFRLTWDGTVKPADITTYGWEANPWVWVIEFERVSKEDALKGE